MSMCSKLIPESPRKAAPRQAVSKEHSSRCGVCVCVMACATQASKAGRQRHEYWASTTAQLQSLIARVTADGHTRDEEEEEEEESVFAGMVCAGVHAQCTAQHCKTAPYLLLTLWGNLFTKHAYVCVCDDISD